jgi:hypothetical protein
MAIENYSRSVAERFHKKYERVPFSGCWLWTGSTVRDGYGTLMLRCAPNQKACQAHRASWLIHRGEIPVGLKVLHRCDVPACVNPEHLFLGSQRDNMLDMNAKGRRGKLPRRKLTESAVAEIRDTYVRSYGSLLAAAQKYGVSTMTIMRVLNDGRARPVKQK